MSSESKVIENTPSGISLASQARFHLVTLWLFTVRDIPALVIPQTAFGIIMSASGYATTSPAPDITLILWRAPLVAFWNWINVLLFAIANQRLRDSVVEDQINKPWRPLPSNRISETQARRLLLATIPLVLLTAEILGGLPEALLLMVMTWMYNDLGGADDDFIMRNLLNAFGITCYSSASTIVASGQDRNSLSSHLHQWLGIVCGIVFTTLQIMDLADMEGDMSRGRRTLPLMYGEQLTRLSVIFCVVGWSVICPSVWNVRILSWTACMLMGGFLSARTYYRRGFIEDKRNFHLWSVWTMTLYLLPLFKRLNL